MIQAIKLDAEGAQVGYTIIHTGTDELATLAAQEWPNDQYEIVPPTHEIVLEADDEGRLRRIVTRRRAVPASEPDASP